MKKYTKDDKDAFYTFMLICVVMIVLSSMFMCNCNSSQYLDDKCYEKNGTYEEEIKFLKETENWKNIKIDTKTIDYIKEKYFNSDDTLNLRIWLHEHLSRRRIGSFIYSDLSAISVNGEIIVEHSWLSHHTTDFVMLIIFSIGLILLIVYRIRRRNLF